MASASVDHKEIARLGFGAIEDPGSVDLDELVHLDYRNHEAHGAEADLRGPAAFARTVVNLNRSFSGLRFEILAIAGEDDLVAVRTVMSGKHTGPMRNLDPTGRSFSQGQSHWFRVADGQLIEHWANRDDLGFLHQVGAAPADRVGGAQAGSAAAIR